MGAFLHPSHPIAKETMSVRAEHRYVAFAARQADARMPDHNTMLVQHLNSLPKNEGAGTPFDDILFVQSHGGWFAECPTTGYGYWYKTLRQAVRAWRVVVMLKGDRFVGVPLSSQ